MNGEIQVTMWEHRREWFGHIWMTMNELPVNCCGCNSSYWNKKRVRPI